MIIDCHCHAGKGDGLTGPWDTAAPLDKYLRRATKAGRLDPYLDQVLSALTPTVRTEQSRAEAIP